MSDADLADLSVVAHVLQNRLAAVTGAASLLRTNDVLDDTARSALLDIVERSAKSLEPAIRMLQYGLPAAALLELQSETRTLPRVSSGEHRPYPLPPNESRRLAALERYDVMDRPVIADLDRVARVAAAVVGAPAAFVNLLDADRQWHAAAAGADPVEVPRGDAMCSVTVAERRSIVVDDASVDATFADSPWVTGVLGNVRLYVSIPLLTPDADAVGTLCVIDEQARRLDVETVGVLEDLASLAISVLEARLAARELRGLVEAAAGDGAV